MPLRGKNKHYRIVDVSRHHFNATARLCGLNRDMEDIITATLAAPVGST